MTQSLRRSGFSPRPVHVGFLVCRVTLGQIFLSVLRFPLDIIILPVLYSFVCDRGCINGSVDSVIKQSTFTPGSVDYVWCHASELCWTCTGFASRLGYRFTWLFSSSVFLAAFRKIAKSGYLDGFSWNLIFEYFAKICWEDCWIKIWQE
jgi:hypothetical protein